MKNISFCLIFLSFFAVVFSDTVTADSSGFSYKIGYYQTTKVNQDCYLKKTSPTNELVWEKLYDSSPVDCKGLTVSFDGYNNKIWAAFSVDGGSYDSGYITKKEIAASAFENVLFSSYGKGGGPKVSFISRINPLTGVIEKATFFLARTAEGNINAVSKTNTLVVKEIQARNDGIYVAVDSYYMPPGEGSARNNFLFLANATTENKFGKGSWRALYLLSFDLDKILKARVANPQNNEPVDGIPF